MNKISILRAIGVWLLLSAIGVAIIAFLPDGLLGSNRLFSFSQQHGPTLIDAVGIFIVLSGWVFYLWQLWLRRRALHTIQGYLTIIILLCSLGLCFWALQNDYNLLLGLSAGVATLSQLWLGLRSANG